MRPRRPPRQTLPRAFRNALVGIADFSFERNSRIQLSAGLVVTALGLWLRVSAVEWALLVGSIAAVLAMEAMNCAVERVVDLASPGPHELARQAKDLAAAAVLIASIGAAVVGVTVFWPHLFGR